MLLSYMQKKSEKKYFTLSMKTLSRSAAAASCINSVKKNKSSFDFDILTYLNTSIYTDVSINVFYRTYEDEIFYYVIAIPTLHREKQSL